MVSGNVICVTWVKGTDKSVVEFAWYVFCTVTVTCCAEEQNRP